MLDLIGYPDWIKNKTALDAYYNDYEGVLLLFYCMLLEKENTL